LLQLQARFVTLFFRLAWSSMMAFRAARLAANFATSFARFFSR
jgi:hypothetical protein